MSINVAVPGLKDLGKLGKKLKLLFPTKKKEMAREKNAEYIKTVEDKSQYSNAIPSPHFCHTLTFLRDVIQHSW